MCENFLVPCLSHEENFHLISCPRKLSKDEVKWSRMAKGAIHSDPCWAHRVIDERNVSVGLKGRGGGGGFESELLGFYLSPIQ